MRKQKVEPKDFPCPIQYYWDEGQVVLFPKNKLIDNWTFSDPNKDSQYNEKEAALAHAMAEVAEANGMSANDLQHIFPAVLRMLKSTSEWAK